jgi:hypothetical protein
MSDQTEVPTDILELLILRAVSLARLHSYSVPLYIEKSSGTAQLREHGALDPEPFCLSRQVLLKVLLGASENHRRANLHELFPVNRKSRCGDTGGRIRLFAAVTSAPAIKSEEL